ncbi:DUF6817 domain-containing protein [Streptomyces sp. YGL11-2]|uniref:DUF6817 domain-containing protein n=1 Tax=Streptomyces sp. YGL11-2 TaxID=3414028 RepID=UPI003CF0741C
MRECGAQHVPHPGGTLLAHLVRVERRLAEWGADDALRAAGLCHACYGTDALHAEVLGLSRRDELAAVIGEKAERLVYGYAACDRGHLYPQLGRRDSVDFRDRFTGTTRQVRAARLRWFVELTVANELDLVVHNTEFREVHGRDLLKLFSRWRDLMAPAAWEDCDQILGPEGMEEPAH